MSDGAGKAVRLPADSQAQFGDHGLLDGGRPRPHLVDGHDLVGHRPDRVEQPAERHRGRDLVADVARVVQVEATLEHHLHQAGEVLGEFRLGKVNRHRMV